MSIRNLSLTALALITVTGGCAQQAALTDVANLNGPVLQQAGRTAVAGWQGDVDTAEDEVAQSSRSRAGRMLAAIALERVTGRSISTARLVHN